MIDLLLKTIIQKKQQDNVHIRDIPKNVMNNRYVIKKIRALHSKSTLNETAILINKDIIAYISNDNTISYEYDEEWLQKYNYDLQQIHNDFLQSLESLTE